MVSRTDFSLDEGHVYGQVNCCCSDGTAIKYAFEKQTCCPLATLVQQSGSDVPFVPLSVQSDAVTQARSVPVPFGMIAGTHCALALHVTEVGM
jgi:hypothetical protein